MTARRSRPPLFFERFREELGRYAEGVHRLGPPAPSQAVAGLPEELASFLRSFDGADLFVDAYTLYPAARVRREGELVAFGETAAGDLLALRPTAQGDLVVRVEADSGERLVEGTSFARWLDATVTAEGVVYDREGEFREDVFDETGEELLPEAVVRRERKALRADPEAPAPGWRLGRALERLGRAAEARRALEEVVRRAPDFAWARFDLGRLRRAAGDAAGAETELAAAADAAEAGGDPGIAAFFAAHAARAAAGRGDEAARARLAARALALDPHVARAQREAAGDRLEAGAEGEAAEHLAVAAAVTPRDLELLALRRRLSSPGADAAPARPTPSTRPKQRRSTTRPRSRR